MTPESPQSPPGASLPVTQAGCVDIVCLLCGESNSVALHLQRNGDSIYRCDSCRFEFQFPQPSDERLREIYSSNYFLGSSDSLSFDNERGLKLATARLYLEALQPLVLVPHPRLLEIGCGHGDFLVEAQSRGLEVSGLEYSAHAAERANRRLRRAAVRTGSPEIEPLQLQAYDIIAAFDLIEHLRNPKRALEHFYDALRPGGIIAIATPSLDSWSHHALGRHWMEYKTEHLSYFGRASLTKLLEATGFLDVKIMPNYKMLNLEYVAAHFERYPVPIVTPVIRLLQRSLPAALVRKQIKIVASGVMAIARKPS